MMRYLLAGAVVLGALCACSKGGQDAGVATAPSTADVINLIPDSVSQYNATAGPDGRVVYMRMFNGNSNIFVADSNGASPRRLTDGVWDFDPRWSPDGKWIAFSRETNGNDVLVVPADSGAERVLVSTAAREQLVGWLPDNSGVVYQKLGQRNELWTATLDGKTARLVDANGSVRGMISPDGQLVAYELLDKGRSTLWLRSLATKSTRQLTTEGYERIPDAPGIWSADSKRVLYVSRRSGTADVWSVDVSSGTTVQLTRDVRDDTRPQFSPDGRAVAFISSRGGQPDVWVVADTGGEPERISDDRTIESDVEWTRDGKGLLVSGQDGQAHAYMAAIAGARRCDSSTSALKRGT